MDFSMIILIILAVIVIGGILIYNRLIALRQNRNNAFSDIDVHLQQRFDLVPQLVETVKGYAKHEEKVLNDVTSARANVNQTSGTSNARMNAERALGGALMNLLAVAEAYPDLKADQNFQQLQTELADLENKIAAARRYFNSATAEYNTSLQQFPANLLAGMFGFSEEPFFELDEAEKDAAQKPVKFTFE